MIADDLLEFPERVPMTRIVSFSMHEPIFKPLQKAAEEETDGSVSEWIRLQLYGELLAKGYITKDDIRKLG